MHPTVSEQLRGMARALNEVVAPEVAAPYPADVLAGVIGALQILADATTAVPGYLRWDADRTAELLAAIGVETQAAPSLDEACAAGDSAAGFAALEAHHAHVRALLEAHIPDVVADATTSAAAVAHFRARIDRFPFQQLTPRR
jgi:hypothetical protein